MPFARVTERCDAAGAAGIPPPWGNSDDSQNKGVAGGAICMNVKTNGIGKPLRERNVRIGFNTLATIAYRVYLVNSSTVFESSTEKRQENNGEWSCDSKELRNYRKLSIRRSNDAPGSLCSLI
ncbi:MAG: hypothetical protein NVS9B14_07270 [Candidatus Acidiferrum sp.]